VLFGWFLQDMAKIDKFNERILQELESNGHIINAEFADVVYLH
jgi:DNA-binding Lrp family transcriptional regulator